jgi:ferredoxin
LYLHKKLHQKFSKFTNLLNSKSKTGVSLLSACAGYPDYSTCLVTLADASKAPANAVSSSQRLPRSAAAPSSALSLITRVRHAGDGGGAQALSDGAQARALRDGVNGFPSRLSPAASLPRLRSSAHRPLILRACLSLLPPPVDRQWRSDGNGSQQPLLHQGGRLLWERLCPKSKRYRPLSALAR